MNFDKISQLQFCFVHYLISSSYVQYIPSRVAAAGCLNIVVALELVAGPVWATGRLILHLVMPLISRRQEWGQRAGCVLLPLMALIQATPTVLQVLESFIPVLSFCPAPVLNSALDLMQACLPFPVLMKIRLIWSVQEAKV